MRTAVVTGASSGIGEALARRLDADGWKVVAVARRAERLEELAAEATGVHPLALDLTAEEAPNEVAKAVNERLGGKLDLLVNNAGGAWRARFSDADGGFAQVRDLMELNFYAPVRLTEALLPVLRASKPSAIVNVGSVAGRVARAQSGAYNAAKFALSGWTEALRYEEAPNGVHVGLVLPGFVRTEGFSHEDLRASAKTRWMVSTSDKVVDAILRAGPGGRAEVAVPRPWAAVITLRALIPGIWLRAASGMRR